MIEPRLYRAAFLPALLAAVIAAFSLENRPHAVPQGLPADVLFEGSLASSTVGQIVQDARDRRVGTPGDARTARRVAHAFRSFGFQTTIERFRGEDTNLVNVVGRRPGLSRHEVVLLASRDALSVPDATGSAADTAALMEVARVLAGRATHKTVVLASVDGGTLGDAGARRFAQHVGDPGLVDGALVLSNLGAPHSHGPLLVDWSNDSRRGSLGLRRTATDSLRNELGTDGGPSATPPAQVARLAFPVGLGAQGVLLERGVDAIRLSGSGERAPPPGSRALDDLRAQRYGELGRSALRVVSALDASAAPPEHGPRSYVLAGGGVVPGWALEILAAALILPALVASIDALARAGRRGEAVVPWLEWVIAGTVPFALGLGVGELLTLVGVAKDAPASPIEPSLAPVDGAALGALAGVAFVALLTWVLLRTPLVRRGGALPDAGAPGAGVATALVLCAAAIGTWFLNPFACLLFALPLHCWMLAALSGVRRSARVWLVVIGLLPVAIVLGAYMRELRLGPLEALWYGFLLVTGGQIGVPTALLGCVIAGLFGATVAIVVARWRTGAPAVAPAGDSGPPRPAAVGPATRLEQVSR
ncbi:MAG: hypothetical protein QOJ14_430 [Thermoleophilaceae bacterium]|nr:hypothetical protein [Thermoleophilaceae bacterium]